MPSTERFHAHCCAVALIPSRKRANFKKIQGMTIYYSHLEIHSKCVVVYKSRNNFCYCAVLVHICTNTAQLFSHL